MIYNVYIYIYIEYYPNTPSTPVYPTHPPPTPCAPRPLPASLPPPRGVGMGGVEYRGGSGVLGYDSVYTYISPA
jgi:hypothetical protein